MDRKDERWGGANIGNGLEAGGANFRIGQECGGTSFQNYQAKIK